MNKMIKKQPELVKQALSIITSLKQNLPTTNPYVVEEKFAREFNLCLGDLEKASGYDLSRYKISEDEMKLEMAYNNNGRYCDRALLLTKINAILLFFRIEPEELKIGFRIE